MKRPLSEKKIESLKRLAERKIGKKRPDVTGENNHLWKGDGVGYRSLHNWVASKLGKALKCTFCGKNKTTPKSIHWANKSHKYKRDELDWIQLCAKCHKAYDKKHE